MSGLQHIGRIVISEAATTETQRFLRLVGQRGHEGLVLWCGRESQPTVFEISHILVPRQRAVKTPDGVCAIVEGDELHRINMELYESGLRLIAQVHSHPTDAFHSDTDDDYAIVNTVGCLSLVVPDFAVRDFALRDCAIYRLEPTGRWAEMTSDDAERLIEIRRT
jgi:hypothetical protein